MDDDPEIILPCLDEADALPVVLAALPAGWPVLVVDNGSTDATAAVARALGARVVTEPRRGYGAAVHAGLEAAQAELVAVLDGDGSIDPAVLPGMAALVTAGAGDLAVGRRIPQAHRAWPWHARAGNAVIAATLRRRGVPVHDIAPVRVARRDALLGLGVADRSFGYPLELLLRAGSAGWRIREVPVPYRVRAGPVAVFDPALAGAPARLVRDDGVELDLAVPRWRRTAGGDDRWLLDRCSGPAIDLGCGPGRLVSALGERGVPALGVDVLAVAQRLCRRVGGRDGTARRSRRASRSRS